MLDFWISKGIKFHSLGAWTANACMSSVWDFWIILLPDILPFLLAEVPAASSMCCCMVFGSVWQTDSRTALWRCSTLSAAATVGALDVPWKKCRKNTWSHYRILTIKWYVFHLKKRQELGNNYFLQHFKYGKHHNYLLLTLSRPWVPIGTYRFYSV